MFDLQKKSAFSRLRFRNIDREIEPFFSSFLVIISVFMSVLLFGAGSILGGLLFLVPVAIAAVILWDEMHGAAPEEDS